MYFYRSKKFFSYCIILLWIIFKGNVAGYECIINKNEIPKIFTEEVEKMLKLDELSDRNELPAWSFITTFIRGGDNTDEIYEKMKNSGLLRKILRKTKHYLENTRIENGRDPCKQVFELCETPFNEREEVVSRSITDWGAEIKNESKILDNNKGTILNKDNYNDYNDYDYNDYDYLVNDYVYLYDYDRIWGTGDFSYLSNVIIRATSLLRCDVMDFVKKQTIHRFYIFTYNENGFPRFVVDLKSETTNNDKLEFKVNAIIIDNKGASTSNS